MGKLINNYIYFDSEQISRREKLSNLVFFNHDLLAERGLSKVIPLMGWAIFDAEEKENWHLP